VEELDAPSPTRHTVADALPDVDYAIVLSTCAGSWSYVLGDTVRFISRDPPRIVITGRTSYFMSAFGEHLIGEEIEDAVAAGAMAIRAAMSEFSLGAIFPDANGESGYHLYIVEFEKYPLSPDDAQNFLTELETALFSRNDDYRVERQAYGVIGAPRLLAVPPGTFASWMKSRGRFGGQNKVPRVINDHKIFAELNAFARNAITTARNASTDPS